MSSNLHKMNNLRVYNKENVNPLTIKYDHEKENKAGVLKDSFKRQFPKTDGIIATFEVPKSSTKMPSKTEFELPNNPQNVPEFSLNIREFLQKKELFFQADPLYIERQSDLTEKMRTILVDWLIDVHLKFKLLPNTLFLTVNLIDRYLSKQQISRHQVQLVGIAALMIVAKFEEIYPPLLKDYVSVCDSAYTREQILSMESDILLAVDFNLAQTSSYTFLRHMQLYVQFDEKSMAFGQYVIENALFDMNLLKYSNHVLAAGAVFLLCKVFKKNDWKKDFEAKIGISEKLSKICAKDLFVAMQNHDSSKFAALKRKFSTPQYFEMSKYRIEKISSSS